MMMIMMMIVMKMMIRVIYKKAKIVTNFFLPLLILVPDSEVLTLQVLYHALIQILNELQIPIHPQLVSQSSHCLKNENCRLFLLFSVGSKREGRLEGGMKELTCPQ